VYVEVRPGLYCPGADASFTAGAVDPTGVVAPAISFVGNPVATVAVWPVGTALLLIDGRLGFE
jgi:hypothetical protein